VIEPLLSLLSVTGGGEPGAPHGVAARASSALLLLCLRKDGADAAMRAGGVAKLTTALERGVSEAAGALMNLALHSADAQQAILTGGALPLLVEMLSAGTPSGQEEAAGAIMNLVTNAPHNQKPVADAGAVLPLVMLLSFGGTPTAKEQAAAALGNLALGKAPLRKAIVGAQACPPLVEMLFFEEYDDDWGTVLPRRAAPYERERRESAGHLQSAHLQSVHLQSVLLSSLLASPLPIGEERARPSAPPTVRHGSKGGLQDADAPLACSMPLPVSVSVEASPSWCLSRSRRAAAR